MAGNQKRDGPSYPETKTLKRLEKLYKEGMTSFQNYSLRTVSEIEYEYDVGKKYHLKKREFKTDRLRSGFYRNLVRLIER